ncbi:MAG: RecQ family zinc-binding domain-containing protein, partial [Bacteroidota bacterium]|nr:RecQ family zinc-binding domain-containing protein [Bacteroidota bacterium]
IKEEIIANTLNINIDEAKQILHRLKELEVITYIEAHNKEQIKFIGNVQNIDEINISKEKIQQQKEKTSQKITEITSYILNTNECRSKLLLSYFGEEASKCDICDYCIEMKRKLKNL